MAPVFSVLRFVLGTSWPGTPIIVPFDCSRIVIENEDSTNAMAFRTDPNDPATQKGIPPAQELDITSRADAPFKAGTVIGYAQIAAGTGPAVVSFTR